MITSSSSLMLQAKFITMIIKQGMPVDIKDKKQLTAMHHAIHGNSLDAVKALCEAGADITMEDMEGRRYMEYASMYGSYNILVWFAKKYPELYINDDTKETVLHYAAAQVSVLAELYQNQNFLEDYVQPMMS